MQASMLRDDTVLWYASDLRVLIPLRRRERKPNGGLNEAAGANVARFNGGEPWVRGGKLGLSC